MGVNDGTVTGYAKILDNGSDGDRWNLVILSEGYLASQMTSFHLHALDIVNIFTTTPPFDGLSSAINIHRVDIESNEEGADDPTSCSGGTGTAVDTFLDASFCGDPSRRDLLTVDQDLAVDTAFDKVINTHAVLVLVNSSIYGGSGGNKASVGVAVSSLHPDAFNIALHELGHSAFGLADEYDNNSGAQNHHPGPEPSQGNVTLVDTYPAIKWNVLIDPTTPMPTKKNGNCSKSDTSASPVPAGTVGAFEGAAYYHCGVYRGEFNCKMRNLKEPFCAVCDDIINAALFPFFP
ncbi:M64 family metallopeptidase [Streptomyces sp. NPDC058476]|uniref:M64 family metallopeptidase n=1 Tax=Streptomyces sp. NPDC058476 TaxID=3346519 RepID=UPI003667B4CA